MTRDDFSGFQFDLFGFTIELVTVRGIPRILAIWKNTHFIWRIEV
jgi:hypothetical protein